jgi:hypothetical protein
MTPVLIAFAVAFVATVALVGTVIFYRRRGVRGLLRRTLLVHTKDGKSFRGILVAEYADCLVLEHGELLDDKVTVGGRTVILRANVSWAQDVTGMTRPDSGGSSDRFQVSRDEVS